jgi:hypothetical protein
MPALNQPETFSPIKRRRRRETHPDAAYAAEARRPPFRSTTHAETWLAADYLGQLGRRDQDPYQEIGNAAGPFNRVGGSEGQAMV